MITSLASRLRLPRHLRVEDVALFAWLVLGAVLAPAQGTRPVVPGQDPVGGLFDLAALCGALVCVVARRRDGTQTGLISGGDLAYAVGPLFGAVAFTLDETITRLGLTGALSIVPLVLPIAVAVAARMRLAPTSAPQRRALVTPFTLATSGFFGAFLSGPAGLFDLRSTAAAVAGGTQVAEALFVLGLGLVATLLFYLMFVFAPRQLAEREGTPRTWAVRFIVFVLGLALGATLRG